MESMILSYLLIANLAALFAHLAASEISYAGNSRAMFLSGAGLFLAGSSFLVVAWLGITTLGVLVIGAALINALWYTVLSLEAPSGQGDRL